MDKCIKRICGWTGTDDEKKKVPNAKLSKGGITVNDLVCPNCGCRSFYPMNDKTKLSGPKKQRGFINFTMMDFIALLIVFAIFGWVVSEGIIWLFSHIHISWV